MYRLLAMLVLLSAAVAQHQSDFDTVIDTFFGLKNNTPAAADGPVQNTTGSVGPQSTVSPAQNTGSNENVLSSSTVKPPPPPATEPGTPFEHDSTDVTELENTLQDLIDKLAASIADAGLTVTSFPTQNKGGPTQSESGPAQNEGGPTQNEGGPAQKEGLTQNISGASENTTIGIKKGPSLANILSLLETVAEYELILLWNKINTTSTNDSDPAQNTSGPAQNTSGPIQNESGPVQNGSGPVQYESGSVLNASGPAQNESGPVQKASGPVQNANDAGQNTDDTANIPALSSSVSPPEVSDTTTVTPESCVTRNNEAGKCVPYYLCNETQTRDDEYGLIDIHCCYENLCSSYLDVCCPPANQVPSSTTTSESRREGCGYRNPDGVGLRFTGLQDNQAQFGEFPWTVAILNIKPLNETEPGTKQEVYVGGGSLIHPSVVLTAAHTVARWPQIRVRAGEWDTQSIKEIYPYQERDVAKMVIHNDYNKGNLFYDVALLFLAIPMDPAPNVGVVCLPSPDERVQGAARCLTTGWGKEKFEREGSRSAILKKVELPIVDRASCVDSLRRTRLGNMFELHASFMCAGAEPGKDACMGDGGSPLVCPIEFEPGRYMQSGIVAWGIGCGENGTPGVYVDVAKQRAWIDDKVKGQGYLIDGYSYTV